MKYLTFITYIFLASIKPMLLSFSSLTLHVLHSASSFVTFGKIVKLLKIALTISGFFLLMVVSFTAKFFVNIDNNQMSWVLGYIYRLKSIA